ncbi:hypothetical protein AWC38_SpisGene7782 [Stylophora pistillata]|uniref:DDE Tnp4 domain-containing protein n=1 Tax=Stylophora pistillata TaxID=50429 RepID=A0A2B4SG90_STYPI|nr:hypothetical protein AWC38_SpisGene7782 [Stylophora pistillata]
MPDIADIILKHCLEEFIKKYPNTIVIVDATELKIQVPSSLQKHTESYSTYKPHTTFKSPIRVDPNGGIMFLSQLFEGSISDKQIVQRSGFLETVKQRVQCGELKGGDAIMADKGFDIGDDLAKLKLKLNIPPFLKDKTGFEEGDVIKTQTITWHHIHVERAIVLSKDEISRKTIILLLVNKDTLKFYFDFPTVVFYNRRL